MNFTDKNGHVWRPDIGTATRRDLLRATGLAFASNILLGSNSLAAMLPIQDTGAERVLPTGPGRMFGPGPQDWWDSERVSCPRVLQGSDGKWRMWYYGRDADFDREILLPTGRAGLATSDDGLHWERVQGPLTMGAVFEPHPDPDRFDSGHIGISDIHYRDGIYWMWYFGGDQVVRDVLGFPVKGFPLRPGCAMSRDGINWTRFDGPYSGALLDVGAPGEFDSLMVAWPQVISWPDGSWRMYYHGINEQQHYTMGWAESADGLRWEKRGPLLGPGEPGQFDDMGIATRHIVRIENQWVMFYEGCRNIGSRMQVDRQIGVATSIDGLVWNRINGPGEKGSVIANATSDSDSGAVWDRKLGCPNIVSMEDGSMRLYYIGSNEQLGDTELDSVNQIGVAMSDGDILNWKRWTPN